MNIKKISSLLRRNEGEKLDFKQTLPLKLDSEKKEFAKDVCAIANSKGGRGYILIGIEDKSKKIIGLDKNDFPSEEKIQQIISSRCEPPIPISVDISYIQKKKIAIITIYDGGQKPYQLRENGAFYIRRGSTNDTMRKLELIESFEENITFSLETCPIMSSSVSLLNMDLVKEYFSKKSITLTDENRRFLLESAGIIHIEKENGKEHCTLGGLLVFSDYNSICIPQNMIKITNTNNRENSHIVQGNLLSIIEKTESILRGILPEKYPLKILMEAINNAVLYREYSSAYKSIDVKISKKTIVIVSPGQMILNNIHGKKIRYNKRNLWLYEKLTTLDSSKFLNSRSGIKKLRKAFKGNVNFINSKYDDTFKVILPGIKDYTEF